MSKYDRNYLEEAKKLPLHFEKIIKLANIIPILFYFNIFFHNRQYVL